MQQLPRRSRLTKLVVGTIVGSVLSLGAVSGTASANQTSAPASGDQTVQVTRGGSTSWLSGIRW